MLNWSDSLQYEVRIWKIAHCITQELVYTNQPHRCAINTDHTRLQITLGTTCWAFCHDFAFMMYVHTCVCMCAHIILQHMSYSVYYSQRLYIHIYKHIWYITNTYMLEMCNIRSYIMIKRLVWYKMFISWYIDFRIHIKVYCTISPCMLPI